MSQFLGPFKAMMHLMVPTESTQEWKHQEFFLKSKSQLTCPLKTFEFSWELNKCNFCIKPGLRIQNKGNHLSLEKYKSTKVQITGYSIRAVSSSGSHLPVWWWVTMWNKDMRTTKVRITRESWPVEYVIEYVISGNDKIQPHIDTF